MEGIAYLDAATPAREDVFMASVGPHYPALVTAPDGRWCATARRHSTWRRRRTCARIAHGTVSTGPMSGPGSIRSVCGWPSTNEAASTAGESSCTGGRRPTPQWVVPEDRGLDEALRGLRREHRAVLLLNAVDGYTQAEIAAMLQIPPGTVASWLARSKAHVREALTDA